MPSFLRLSHDKGLDKARTKIDDGPIVSNMIPEEKFREEDLVGAFSSFSTCSQVY